MRAGRSAAAPPAEERPHRNLEQVGWLRVFQYSPKLCASTPINQELHWGRGLVSAHPEKGVDLGVSYCIRFSTPCLAFSQQLSEALIDDTDY